MRMSWNGLCPVHQRSFWNVSGCADWTMLEGSASTFSACIQ